MNHVLANHREIVLIVKYRPPHLQRMGISPAERFARFFTHGFALFGLDEETGAWRPIAEKHAGKLPSTSVTFVRPDTNQCATLKQHEF